MAEGQRRSAPKPAPLDDEAVARHDRLTLVLYLLAGVAIIAGMVVLSEFLSQGKPSQIALIIAGSLFGLCALGFLGTFLMRRIGDRKAKA